MKKVKICGILFFTIILFLILLQTESLAYTNYFVTTKYKISVAENKILSNLEPDNLTVKNILENVSSGLTGSSFGMKAYNAAGEEKTSDESLGTGCMLKVVHLTYNYTIDTATLVLYGDTTGDGKITSSDALAIVKNKTGKVKMESEYCIEAGRITENTRTKNAIPSSADALAIIKYKLGKANIGQFRNIPAKISSYEDLYEQLGQCNTNLVFDSSAENYNEITKNYKKLQDIVAKYCKADMSETVKALVLHDYLVAGSTLNYETKDCSATSTESNICNIGGTMNQLGFANTYTCLLGIAGIQSEVRRDKYANYRAINEVIIDGETYYVSCGADSHISKVEGKGQIRRYYFLRNTEQLEKNFWEKEAFFSYTPSPAGTSTSTKYYGVKWPTYRSTLDYKNSEVKLVSGVKVINNLTELKEALMNNENYTIGVIDADTESLNELDQFCKKVVKKYITDDMSEAEKALTIYDFICSNFMRKEHEAYTQRTNKSNSEYDRAWGYYKTSLLSGMGDCISATNSFNTLCAYVGIETQVINEHQVEGSHGLGNHHWSLVKIDGQWYHCDCEGSDYYQYGVVDRTWFLYSDARMRITENTVQPCTSTKYDSYEWPEFKGVEYYQDKTGIIDQRVPATSLWINQRTEAVIGDVYKVRVRIFPYGSTDKATFSSSNKNVATIDSQGNVTVIAKGTTTITVTVNGISKSYTMTTGAVPESATMQDITLKVGETKKPPYTVNPADAIYEEGYWYTFDNDIITVDENGNVTALKAGTAKLNMQFSYLKGLYRVIKSTSCKVTVTE